jgi:hypothetical protein
LGVYGRKRSGYGRGCAKARGPNLESSLTLSGPNP